MGKESATFDAKVAELVALCRPLDVPHILTVRRMTREDPESRKWATEKQIDIVFMVILSDALKRMGLDDLDAAAEDEFEPLLPQASPDARDQDRWLLYDLSRQFLANYERPSAEADKVSDTAADDDEDEDYEQDRPFVDFPTLFDDTLTRYMRKTLKVLAVKSNRPNVPPPFYLAPRFRDCFAEVTNRLILPQMRKSRAIKDLGTARNWEKNGAVTLIAMVQSGDTRNNPILHQWDTRWSIFQPDRDASRAKHKSLEDTPWPDFLQHAARNDYVAPNEERIWILRQILRWEAEAMADGWEAISQLYKQEFSPSSKHDRARPGAFRDGLIKWINRLPAHGGEALAAKAFFEFPKCDKMFLRSILHTFGTSRQRMDAVPLLADFMENLPK